MRILPKRRLVLGGALGAAVLAGPFPPRKERCDIVYSTEVVTPHVPWAPRLPGGPLKGFFIPSVARGRDMVELMQRIALEPTTVTIDRNWDVNCWGIGDFYGHEFRGDRDDFQIVYGYVEQELISDTRFDVLLIPGLNGWSRLTRAARDAIVRRVRDGAGLVLLHPFVGDVKGHPFKGDEAEGDTRIWDLSPLVGVPDDFVNERGYPELNAAAIRQAPWRRAKPHFITEGIPLDLIQSGQAGSRFYTYEARGDVLIQSGDHPVLAVKPYGKGRVVAFAYVEDGFLPEPVDQAETGMSLDYWEYQYALLARSLLWAAGSRSGLTLAAPRVEGEPPASLALSLRSETPREVEIEVRGRSEFGTVQGAYRERRWVRGETALAVSAESFRPASGFGGGRQIVDVIVRNADDGATLDWGSVTFEVPQKATLASVRTSAPVYREGDTMSVVARAAGRLDGLTLRLEVRDDLGRLLGREDKGTRGESDFLYCFQEFLGQRAFPTVSLLEEGRIVDQLRAEPVVVVQRERRQKEYQGILSFEEPRGFLASVRKRRLRSLAMDSGFTWGGKVNDSLEVPRGWFGVYWYDRGPTTPLGLEQAIRTFEKTGDFAALQYLTKKELYRRTGDKKFLVRSPCLDDPEVLATLSGVARSAARRKAVYNMDYYFVGDEGSLTSYTDPMDFCFGPHTLAHFRGWLLTQYGSLEAMNRAWHAGYKAWDEVFPATTGEARKSGVFPPWADHRTYMEVSFANAYRVVREAVVEGDPEGRIALSGTQVTTPWDGADWSRLDRVVDDFLSYDGGNQWDLHRSFAKPGARIGFWTGYGRSGVGVRHEIWSAALQGVLHPNVFWSYSVVNPDLTWSRSGRDMGTIFEALRFQGIGKLLMESERLSDGIAVHYSMRSVHAAGILGLHEKAKNEEDDDPGFPADRDGWVRGLTDLGLGFDFVSSEQIETGALDPARYKALVLPLSLALSPGEAGAIEGFARAGGIVIADGAPGLMDEHCAWRSVGLLNAFFGIAAPPSEGRRLAAPRPGGAVSVPSEGRAWGLDVSSLQGLEPLEASIVARGAGPLLEVGGIPAAFAQPVGGGWALYLNVLLDGYPRLRKDHFGGGAYRALLSGLLRHLGVSPAVELCDPRGRAVGPARIARFRLGESDIVGILLDPTSLETVHGADGVSAYEGSRRGGVLPVDVEVRLSQTTDVMNVRTGDLYGTTDRVRASVVPGDALILALGPVGASLRLEGPKAARRGDHVRFAIGSSRPGKHLLRCHVYGPDGRFRAEYARNLLVSGTDATFVVPTAFDDAVGNYRVRVTDVLGGTSADGALELR